MTPSHVPNDIASHAASPRSALFRVLPASLGASAPSWLRVRITDLAAREAVPSKLTALEEVSHVVVNGWVGSRAVFSSRLSPLCHISMRGDSVGLSELWGGSADRSEGSVSAPASYALGDARLASIPTADLRRVVAEVDEWREFVLGEMAHHLRRHHLMHAVIGGMVAPDRLIHLLSHLMSRHRAIAGPNTVSLPLPLTQGEIGQILGLTNVSVNRAFRTLEGKEMLKLERGRVTLLQEQAWVGDLAVQFGPHGSVRRHEPA